MNLTLLKEISDDIELWSGTKLRHHNVGKNTLQELDYYDYILAYANWDPNSMMLVNITENDSKAGYVYGGTVNTGGSASVNKSALQHTLGEGLTDWYILE